MSGETMLERAGYAILVADTTRTNATDRVRSSMWANSKETYIALAKAALLAIREPSKKAIDEGVNCSPDHETDYTSDGEQEYRYLSHQGAGEVFTAMIDAILNESPSPSVTHQIGDKT